MQCNEFHRQAGEWMEGAGGPAAREHLEGCAGCRALMADLQAIAAMARELDEDAPGPPPRVWTALRAQLEAEGFLRQRSWAGRWLPIFQPLPRPALAGTYLAVLLAAAALFTFQTAPLQPVAQVSSLPGVPELASLATAHSQLAGVETRTVALVRRQNPRVGSTYRQNLAIIDDFIALCEKTVREEPGNELAVEYLHDAYQQKADLLASMLARGVRGE